MAQVDAARFLANLPSLFAPKIHEGQTFTAYMDTESNSFTVQADNVIGNSAVIDTDKIAALSQEVEAVAKTASTVFQQCTEMLSTLRSISSFVTEIETLHGDGSGQTDFAFASLADDVAEIRLEVDSLASIITSDREASSTSSTTLYELKYLATSVSDRVNALEDKSPVTNTYYQFIGSTENEV